EYKGLLSRMDNVYDVLVPIKKGQNLAIVVENQGRIADASGNNDTKSIDSNISSLHQQTEGIGAYIADFPGPEGEVLDTFLQVDGWKKGFAFLNSFNLGRYWPAMGPQMTLYVPSVLFQERNRLLLLELERAPCGLSESCVAEFVKTPVINGAVPDRP
ncbi:beta-galactosidase, partial [Ixodes scapularis]